MECLDWMHLMGCLDRVIERDDWIMCQKDKKTLVPVAMIWEFVRSKELTADLSQI